MVNTFLYIELKKKAVPFSIGTKDRVSLDSAPQPLRKAGFHTTEFISDAKTVESADCWEMTMPGCAVRGSTPSSETCMLFGALE